MPVLVLKQTTSISLLQDTYSGTLYASAKNALDKVGENDWVKNNY